MNYRVHTVIQSIRIDENEPVEVQWYTGSNLASAMAAMCSAAAEHEDKMYLTHAVNLTITQS